ncbi:MAG: sugar phosphate isomerase/epimerase [Candidatus Eremiobacteraeota bacterium]|nr:sugar phosphate isomerase/epimerase [Candidatus Eremiobacteraeota bacterium]
MDGHYEFGVSEFTTWPNTFEQDVALYSQVGVDCIEVTEFKLDRARIAAQFETLSASGLRISSVQATVHSLFPDGLAGEPTDSRDRARHIRESIERIAPYVPRHTPFVAVTGAAPGGNVQHVVETAVPAFRELAKCADSKGMRLAFEPLNPMLMNSDTAIWSLGLALQLVEEVDHPSFGLCVDLWNIWQTSELLEIVEQADDRVFLVQVSDYRTPRSHNDRISLGEGEIPLAPILRTIRSTSYDGPYVLEIFSGESLPNSLWRADFAAVLRQNMAAFADVWENSRP